MYKNQEWRVLLARAWEEYARFSLRGGGQHQQPPPRSASNPAVKTDDGSNNSNTNKGDLLDHAARCLGEALRAYSSGSDESTAATAVFAAVSVEQGQLDKASALLEDAREKRLPQLEDGADGYAKSDKQTKNKTLKHFICSSVSS